FLCIESRSPHVKSWWSHLEVRGKLVQGALPCLLVGDAAARMPGHEEFYGCPARVQDLWRLGMNDHAVREGGMTGAHQRTRPFNLDDTDAAVTRDTYGLVVTESRDLDTGLFGGLENCHTGRA